MDSKSEVGSNIYKNLSYALKTSNNDFDVNMKL